MKKEKLLLLFPDGVGIRNYLYSNTFQDLDKDLVLFHNFDLETIKEIGKNTVIDEDISIPEYKESKKEKFLRELICLSRLYYNNSIVNNPTLLTNWNRNHKAISKKVFYKFIEFLALRFKKYSSILKLEKKYQEALRENDFYKEVKSILKEVQPSLLFCSHQRALKAATIFRAAADLGIPTATVIYSWDNLPKARLALQADNYFLWSEHMKKELNFFYPEIQEENIHVTGTPQFEFYNQEENILERDFFYRNYNLDQNKKIICFSGDDVKTSPDDPDYLKDIAQEIVSAGLQDQYQILFRRCPVDFSGRYYKVVEEFRDLIKEAPPLWYFSKSKEWSAVYPTIDDVKLLVSTAFYSDIVVNVGSTMAFDFGKFDKPCVFINYDQNNKKNENWSVNTIYQFQHFRSMPNPNAVIWLNSREEIIDKIIYKKGWKSMESLKQWSNEVIGSEHVRASKNISELLKKLIKKE
ncbi:hypothetical protein [Flavobacterium quisquiliarum]|jgi:hypothetical protein|uniref:Monogalactosyldiacylglycerol (MGDG) synthase n=1 Tax=Flavobacterium quisquiliarum TaxID=1834436 RepID=A0ABV8WE78_9FLAO|nr:hypothetical protein [Flavobacterium quisquiliarum]MBW1657728.1 hypothetical protein [Flavobacterium quisquiliarum]NWL04067.1 hypothetical protein [Flavobacterium collinsii]